jgi:murein DD-endopeptidase MepM/ murein hydrolase activator NlpD
LIFIANKREIYVAHIGSQDGIEAHTKVDYDKISCFYAKTRGIKKDEKLHVEIREKISLFPLPGIVDPVLLEDKNVHVDDSGAIKTKITWHDINPKIGMRKVYAVVKDGMGVELYNTCPEYSGFVILLKTPTITKMAEYKSAVVVGSAAGGLVNRTGTCACKDYDLIWGNKVSCEFRKKVVEICKDLWPDNYKKMSNGLMAVINAETGGSFKAHQIMGKPLQDLRTIKKDDFYLSGKKSSRAVGLIQFTQDALIQIGEFTSGSGFDKLHEVKLKFAQMGEVKQLDYVKKYFEESKNRIKNPEDIYLQVFAPSGVGKNDDEVLYREGTDYYTQNKSIDTENNSDGKIQRSEILGRYRISYATGLGNKVKKITCGLDEQSKADQNWHDPVDDPMLCLYTQNGNYRPRYNVFGKVRTERSNIKHQGIDLLALPDSNAYACVDAYIEFVQVQNGYGNVVCLKVKDTEKFLSRKRDFELVYEDEGEILQGDGFNFDGDIYLFYAHLKEVLITEDEKEVTCGKVIGLNGTSGYGSSKDPHLHFEIRNSSNSSGLNNRCHPGYFVYYKNEAEMTQIEKDYHKEISEKFWD